MNDLFEEKSDLIKTVVVAVPERLEAAIATLYGLFMQGVPISVAWSGGKDSTVLLMLALWAGEKAVANGETPMMWILNADTCPPEARHHADVVGCGSSNVSGPDEDGLFDCYDCGMFFNPALQPSAQGISIAPCGRTLPR